MQLIVELPVDAEEYISQKFQHSITAPAACPHCRACASLQALGYYLRSVTGKKAVALTISVRRFRCKVCKKTVSILPAFAQPYRLVRNHAIHRYFRGHRNDGDTKPWRVLLRRYWKKFCWWVSRPDAVWHSRLDHAPPPRSGAAWWELIVDTFGSVIVATRVLVTDSQVTLFGRYRCHRPNAPPG